MMTYGRYLAEQLTEHLYVVGQDIGLTRARLTDCYVYLIIGDTSILAIDAGGGASWPFIRAAAERGGFAELPIKYVLLTHGHPDHVEGLSLFREQGARVFSSGYTATHLMADTHVDSTFEQEGVLKLGDWQVETILTPGHTPGCTSYLLRVDGKLCLFAGDLIMIDGNLGYAGSEGFSQEQVLSSLKRLAAMPMPDLFMTGHGFVTDSQQLLETAIHRGESGGWVVKK
jgi:glyoxylase-like metal-dependent hydrolase (beta-lactamase superfamily II)